MDTLRTLRFLPLLGVLAALSAAAQPAAQPGRPASLPAPGIAPATSLQSQLGSIPLVSPRAAAKPSMVRTVRLTQLAGRAAAVPTREIECPDTGCQQLMSLVVDGVAQPFLADIQFVGRGTYVSLQSRSAAVGSVVDFQKGRAGPVFLRTAEAGTIDQQLAFTAAPAASLRKLERPGDSNLIAAGNLYTRKREPDIVLRVEVELARERK